MKMTLNVRSKKPGCDGLKTSIELDTKVCLSNLTTCTVYAKRIATDHIGEDCGGSTVYLVRTGMLDVIEDGRIVNSDHVSEISVAGVSLKFSATVHAVEEE